MKTRLYITILLLLATILICFALPKPHYESPDIIGTLDYPSRHARLAQQGYGERLNLKQDDRYLFISDVFPCGFTETATGRACFFLVLDAGNFHHPKVCFVAVRIQDAGP